MKNKLVLISMITIVIVLLIIVGIVFFTKNNNINESEDFIAIQNSVDSKLEKEKNNERNTIDDPYVLLDPYGISPLTAIIIFNTKSSVQPKITIVGKNDIATFTNTFSLTKNHILPIYGLYPDHNNKVIIEYGNIKKEISIKTNKLPKDFSMATVKTSVKEELNNDLIFVTTSPSGGYTAAYDYNGDVRWYLTGKYTHAINRLKNGNIMLSSPRTLLPVYHAVGLVEMDLIGKVYKEYTVPTGFHHDYYEMDNGDLIVGSSDLENGNEGDLVLLLDRKTGLIKKTWDLKDILPTDQGKQEHWTESSWFHNNSIFYDKTNNSLILSGRHQDAIISINFDTSKLNWIIGDPTNWDSSMQKYFFKPVGNNFEWQYAQHSAKIAPNGDILIFDNGNNRSKIKENYIAPSDNYSRALIYNINVDNMTISQKWQYGKERGSELYSSYIGNFDYISDNHYLANFGGIFKYNGLSFNVPAFLLSGSKLNSVIMEFKDNKVIFEMIIPNNYFRAKKMSLYSNNNFSLDSGIRLGNLGVTQTDNNDKTYDFGSALTYIPDRYAVELTKESDRFIFKSEIFNDSNVSLILKNKKEINVYQKIVKTRFSRNVIMNISSYKMEGSYDIYLEIENVLYNTKKTVKF